ncbi:MAG: fused signal recognition particle receptor [Gammaproteobacteria bacterium]|nr:MAG: fused signal recognition particle receptor [Gammaproteobacteria bacterium]TND02993.1 MAG: fused signal recognition particle receptor [Gammaproteobacteria bacterium]
METKSSSAATDPPTPVEGDSDAAPAAAVAAPKRGMFGRLRDGLSRTRASFTEGLASMVLGGKKIDDELFEQIDEKLLLADVGVEAATAIIADLTRRVARKQLNDADALLAALREEMAAILAPCSAPLVIPDTPRPFVILMVGINGAGKTTTIGKLAKRLQADGKTVMLAAGDTFRAAAVEQLMVWGERNNIPVVARGNAADPAAVIYDAFQTARSRGIDVLIADTAGRLHTQQNLIEELKKIKRVIGKIDATAPHETMLIVDAGTGQNALVQAQQFHAAVGLTGITVTKLDGTAKGGIVFAIAKKLGIPLRFIGVGEAIDDLRPFNADEFVSALFDITSHVKDRAS